MGREDDLELKSVSTRSKMVLSKATEMPTMPLLKIEMDSMKLLMLMTVPLVRPSGTDGYMQSIGREDLVVDTDDMHSLDIGGSERVRLLSQKTRSMANVWTR
jgi:hypothetical protein